MVVCPYCQASQGQVKAGKNDTIQRYKCSRCQRRYTPKSRPRGYPDGLHIQALDLYKQGITIRQISRDLAVNHQTVANWVRSANMSDNAAFDSPSQAEDPITASRIDSPATTSPALIHSAPEQKGSAPAEKSDPFHDDNPARKERATIEDVARRAGVSATTISNFINAKGRMSEATQSRISRAMEELHFTPSALTRAIRQRRTRILGLLIFGLGSLGEDVGKSITPPLVAGIYEAAERAGHDILLFTGWPDRPERRSGLDFLNGHIDGLLWVAPNLQTSALDRLAAAGLPVVCLLSRHVPDAVGYVNIDNFAGMRDIVAHLKAEGRRRIAYIGPISSGGTLNSNFLDRLEGYRAALPAAGMPYDPAIEVVLEKDFLLLKSYSDALEGWLRLQDPPDAVVVSSDSLAEKMCEAIIARGLRIPEDIAVTGFNDIPDASHLYGGLTTIRQPFREMGRLSAEHLVASIEGAPSDTCRTTLTGELVVRASTTSRL